MTGNDTYISESTRDRRRVEKVRTRLLARVDQQRTGSTKVTLGYTIDAWLQVHEADDRTLEGYRGYAERTIKPALGDVSIAKVSARVLEQFYAQLRRCRARCTGRAFVEHFTDEAHECDQVVHRRVRDHDCAAARCRVLACRPHVCKPMSASTVRQIHFIISGALSTAVRWDWIPSNPAAMTKKPRQPRRSQGRRVRPSGHATARTVAPRRGGRRAGG